MPLANFLFSLAHWSLWGFLPVLLREAGHAELVGWITGAYQLVSALVLLPAGWFTDRWSPRALTIVGSLACAGGAVAYAVPGLALVATALSGVGASLFLVSLSALFYKRLEVEGAGRSTSHFVASGIVGYALGPMVGGLTAPLGIGATCAVACALYGVTAVACATLPATAPVPVRLGAYVGDLRSGGPLFLVAVVLLTATHGGVEFVGLSTVATESAGLSSGWVGAFYGVVGAWTALVTLRMGSALDRSPRPVLWLALGIGVSGVFQATTGLVVGFGSLVAVRMAHTLGDAIWGFVLAVLTARVFPKARVGGLFGLTQLVRSVGTGLAAGAAGAVEPRLGFVGAFAISGVVMIVGALSILASRGSLRQLVGLQAPEPSDRARAAREVESAR